MALYLLLRSLKTKYCGMVSNSVAQLLPVEQYAHNGNWGLSRNEKRADGKGKKKDHVSEEENRIERTILIARIFAGERNTLQIQKTNGQENNLTNNAN